MSDLDSMSIEKFRLWSINALKVFLSCRKKSTDGTFDELSARAFCAWEEKLPVDATAEQAELRLSLEYKEKLQASEVVIPDPFSVPKKLWKGEKDGMSLWPSLYISDIALFMNGHSSPDIVHRLMNEYKEGKGFRYFQCEWVKEVFYHNISDSHPFCILKSRVTPSQCINNKDYSVWISVKKDSENGVGGQIISAYCTCTAGMLGACNHIAGVLFRVESYVKRGSATSTDRLSKWNVPKTKNVVCETRKSIDWVWKKGHYTKLPEDFAKEHEKLKLKQNFTPLSSTQEKVVSDSVAMRKRIYDLLKDDVPETCFIDNCEKRRRNASKPELPLDFLTLAKEVNENNKYLTSAEKREAFISKIAFSELLRKNLKSATINQSNSDIWHRQRHGRLTASLFHRISTRVDTIRKAPATDPTKLVSAILGKTPTIQTAAMKHGLSLEPFAKKLYRQLAKKQHKKFKSSESGLTVDINNPFIAASADLEVQCQCCGTGLCEIKCPESIKNTAPSIDNLDYLVIEENNSVSLKKNHPYYTQIQGQMAICERKYCDLFIFTFHGHQLIRVLADEEFWITLKEKLVFFWNDYVLKEIIVKNDTELIDNNSLQETPQVKRLTASSSDTQRNLSVVRRCLASSGTNSTKSSPSILQESTARPAKRKKTKTRAPVYLCGICAGDVIEEPKCESEQSIQCDSCLLWIHFGCCGLSSNSVEENDKWFCSRCCS